MADIWKDRYPKLMKNLNNNTNNNNNSKKSKLNYQQSSFEEQILNDKNLLLTNSSLWPLQGFLNHNLLARICTSSTNSVNDNTTTSPSQSYDNSPYNLTHLKSTNKSIILETLSDFTHSGSSISTAKDSDSDNDGISGNTTTTTIKNLDNDHHGAYNSDMNSTVTVTGDAKSTSSNTVNDINIDHETVEDTNNNNSLLTLTETSDDSSNDCQFHIMDNFKHTSSSSSTEFLTSCDNQEHDMTSANAYPNKSKYVLKDPSEYHSINTSSSASANTNSNVWSVLVPKVKIEKITSSNNELQIKNLTIHNTSISNEQVIPYIGVKMIRLAKSQYCAVMNSK